MSQRALAYENSDRITGVSCGGLGAIHQMLCRLGLPEAINQMAGVLKRKTPYHDSDHVLSLVYSALRGGKCLDDVELLRADGAALDMLGATRLPGATTAGDYLRRFDSPEAIDSLMDAINVVRKRAWRQMPEDFFDEAIIDVDSTLVTTTGEQKEGMNMSYKGTWSNHPILVSLANMQDPLFIENRPGNAHSATGAAKLLDRAIDLCRDAGFKEILLRGDTAFSSVEHIDRWDDDGVGFIFGYKAYKSLQETAESISKDLWVELERPQQSKRSPTIKEQIVVEKEYRNITLTKESVTEIEYSPHKAKKSYRMIILKKETKVFEGQHLLFPQVTYFFYLTNDRKSSASDIVFSANQRCNQENLIEQLKNEVGAFSLPVSAFHANWAYMVMTSIAWSAKTWMAAILDVSPNQSELHRAEKSEILRMEFRSFINAFIQIPCQVIKSARKIRLRLIGWNPFQRAFLRFIEVLERPLRC